VNDLFHLALSRPAADRRAFLQEICAGDEALVNEVASLLDAHDQAAEFIEPPVLPAADLTPAIDALVGRTVGHYRIDRALGEGGMGIVYLAEDMRLGRSVALKALPARYTQDGASRDRLKREARAAAALSHPGIATVYALEEFDGHVFIAFEFVPGETLRAELGRGPLPLLTVMTIARALARALAAAHDRGIIHRDLKPENVIRTPDGQIKILDFGLARFREPSAPSVTLTTVGTVMGTPSHMSPEQIRADAVDGRSDIFSLGVMLYELASGVNPFAGADHAATIANVLEAQPPRLPAAAVPDEDRPLRDALEHIILRCLQRAPSARFQSAHDLVRALEQVAADFVPAGVSAMPFDHRGRGHAAAGAALWWWKFHQAAASVTYLALLFPLWWVHEWTPGPGALLLFLAGLVASLVASLLRWHLWFAVRSYPDQWHVQQRATRPLIGVADVAFAAVLLVAALTVLSDHSRTAVVLVGAAVAVVLSFTVIEPATTRAAFGR
jgi:serine/threonine-protein kinase